jgi:hypothetical protein
MAACATSNADSPATELSRPAETDVQPSGESWDGDGCLDFDELVPISALATLSGKAASVDSQSVGRSAVSAPLLIATLTTVVAVAVLYAGLGLVMNRARTAPEASIMSAERWLPTEAVRTRERTSRAPRRGLTRKTPPRLARNVRRGRPRPAGRRRTSAARPRSARAEARPARDLLARSTAVRSAAVNTSQMSPACEFEPSCDSPGGRP